MKLMTSNFRQSDWSDTSVADDARVELVSTSASPVLTRLADAGLIHAHASVILSSDDTKIAQCMLH